MAVVDPNVNITPAYDAVNQALAQRAKIALASGGDSPGLALAQAIGTPVEQYADTQRQQQFQLQKQYQDNLMDVVKNSQQLDVPQGTTLPDIMSGKVPPTLKPKLHTVTQDDIDAAVKSFGVDPDHKNMFDDLLGQTYDQKTLDGILQKRINAIHSSVKGQLTPTAFEYQDASGQWQPAQGFFDKSKGKYFMSNGTEVPGLARPVQKGAGSQASNDHNLDKLETNYRNQMISIRGDAPLKDIESQRNAAITGFNRIDKIEKSGQELNPIDYVDILGQIYKARTGSAPTQEVLKEAKQATSQGDFGRYWTYFTGQQMPATTKDIQSSLKSMVLDMGKQADQLHDGYMQTHAQAPSTLLQARPDVVKSISHTGRGFDFSAATMTPRYNEATELSEAPTVTSKADYDKLKVGDYYKDAQGNPHRKQP